jgi:hypothetical protein
MTPVSVIPDAVAQAAGWHLLALLFERPRPGWEWEVAALARELPDVVLRAVAEGAATATEGEYLRVLGPGGRVSPREVGHHGFSDPGWILSDLTRYYHAFGYMPRSEDPLDHVAVETGFVAYLHLKEALARSLSDEDAVAVTRAAREAFVRDHLAVLAGSLARRLGPDGAGYLAGAADLLAARIPERDRRVLDEDEVDPLADGCGACGSTDPEAARGG